MSRRGVAAALVAMLLLGASLVGGGVLDIGPLGADTTADGQDAADAATPRADATTPGRAPSPARDPVRSDAPAPVPTAGRSAEPAPSPRGTGTPPAPATTPEVDPALLARLDGLLADPALAGATVALHVVDEHGREVFASHPDEPLLPASTMKLVTAAAALLELGGDFRFTTRVVATGPVGADGVLHGDLVLVGGGDPALATPLFGEEVLPERPRTPLERLASQVVAAGVRHVTGRVVGDPSALPAEPVAAGWPDRYLRRGDATRSSGLTIEAGRRLFRLDGVLHSAPADDPALVAAAALGDLLADSGVVVDGQPAVGGPVSGTTVLAEATSPPLHDLLRYAVQRSDNHLADAVFRWLGRRRGDGTWEAAGAAIPVVLAPLRLDWSGAVLADGSGLSRDDRLSARLLTTLDVRMRASPWQEAWEELMAVSGRSGTLRRRLVDTVAEGRVAGKTGSLVDTRTLAGAALGPDGRRYHFALLTTRLEGEAGPVARSLQDEIALALVEDLYDCRRVPVGTMSPTAAGRTPAVGSPGAGEPQATELRCAV